MAESSKEPSAAVDESENEQLSTLCAIASCEPEVGRQFLALANGDLELAMELFLAQLEADEPPTLNTGEVRKNAKAKPSYNMQCPHPDCQRIYAVSKRDLRCRIVRCGGNVFGGKFYQLPPHASRAEVQEWFQNSEWNGRKWEGWPGRVEGCGRPFRFKTELDSAELNLGIFVTWADQDSPEGPAFVDPEGDYSKIEVIRPT